MSITKFRKHNKKRLSFRFYDYTRFQGRTDGSLPIIQQFLNITITVRIILLHLNN
jgi:hypothetical protein